jgi:hypothetical protein
MTPAAGWKVRESLLEEESLERPQQAQCYASHPPNSVNIRLANLKEEVGITKNQ